MKISIYFLSLFLLFYTHNIRAQENIQKSRSNCVRVLINNDTPSGTGFFIDQQYVATCFHVVAKNCSVKIDSNNMMTPKFELYKNIRIVTSFCILLVLNV